MASALFVPLAFEGEVRPVPVLVSQTPRRFEECQVQLAYTLANQAMAALGTMEMRGRLNARAEQQAALARAGGAHQRAAGPALGARAPCAARPT